MTDLWKQKVTIYNDIPDDAVNPRRFDRFVIEFCNVQRGIINKADGTVQNLINAVTVISKDIVRYRPFHEYKNIPMDLREDFFTAQPGDFVVLSEVDDVVTTPREFSELQEKYKDNGISVQTVVRNTNGMDADNISFSNV